MAGWSKESMGLAVLNARAFFIAHILSTILGYPADGFSIPYQYAFAISGLIYADIGIFMLRRILLWVPGLKSLQLQYFWLL